MKKTFEELENELISELESRNLELNEDEVEINDAIEYIVDRNESGEEMSVSGWVKMTLENYPEFFIKKRKSPLGRRIQEEFNGDVISAIHFMLEEEDYVNVKILFSLLADEAFSILTDDDYVALCNNVLEDLENEF
jgi:hypothetical protein